MHELLLFCAVSAARHEYILSVLAGIAAMQPQPVLEKHLVFKPNRSPTSLQERQVGGAQDIQKKAQAVQAQEFFYMQVVADAEEVSTGLEGGNMEDGQIKGNDVVMTGVGEEASQTGVKESNDKQNDVAATTASDVGSVAGRWTLQFRDFPEPARQRPVTSRLIADTPITSGDPMVFMEAMDYTHISTYLLSGHRFTHNSISLFFYRLHIPVPPTNTTQANVPTTKPINLSNPTSTRINLAQTRLLDPSGTYVLQASIRVQDGSKMETMSKGVQELLALKEILKGCVELEMGDRLAADTRVR